MKRWLRILLPILLIVALAVGFLLLESDGYEPLRYGDSGIKVTNAQLGLRALRFYRGTPTGVYDEETEQAVRRFEALNSSDSDGVLSAEEQRILFGSDAIRSSFSVTYFDVGQGDSALVECDGQRMLIDGGPGASVIYTILKEHGIDTLDAVVCTHPHDDHVGGLAGALNYATVNGVGYSCVAQSDNKAFNDFLKYLGQSGAVLTVPEAGDRFELGSATVTVLGPIRESANMNSNSLVLKIKYGSTGFLFTGDAETDEEADILASGTDIRADVLKVGHHGSDTSSSEMFVDAVSPSVAVISVGSKNAYGHPKESVLTTLHTRGIRVIRTDESGEIQVTSDGENVSVTTQKAAPEATPLPTQPPVLPENGTFVINTGNGRFHRLDCDSVSKMNEKKALYTDKTAAELVSAGYTPCGSCNPDAEPKTDAAEAQQAEAITQIPEGTTFVLNENTKRYHSTDCSSVIQMKAESRAYTDLDAETLIQNGYMPCSSCQTVKDAEVSAEAMSVPNADYVVNVKSGKFHLVTCSGAQNMKEENREYFSGTREELLARGLEPCGSCKP